MSKSDLFLIIFTVTFLAAFLPLFITTLTVDFTIGCLFCAAIAFVAYLATAK